MRRSPHLMAVVMASELYGAERFFADERRRVEYEFYAGNQSPAKPAKKAGAYGTRLLERFAQKRKQP